ncbi:Dihydrofolate reductase [Dyella sp. OK004]|uniref:dihydrofolate reductase family protein n=1 Tax=Dyella sp. OK004 TaxID=1855292 RepID=UPI0008EE2586|nr:dihydrofolate reductase family protein [Dyella sp. OK004]SFS11743.1 Dihydrofolate reductase [Dyella sp. OK004]
MATATATKRKLVLKMSVSLDGFVAGPNGEADWVFRTSGGNDSTEWVLNTLSGAGVHIMGSRSYHDMAAFWPYSDMPFAPPMNDIPKVIFSRKGVKGDTQVDPTPALAEAKARNAEGHGVTPTEAVLQSWAEPTVARGDLAEEILRLKEQPGNYILAHGGAQFAQSFVASGLIDEYRLGIHPVVLGQGQPLFSALHSPVDLRLVSMTPFRSGVVAAVYQPT